MTGKLYGGQQPVVGATVSVFEVGSSGYGTGSTLKASVTTDGSGAFSFPAASYSCTASNTPMYIVATGGDTGAGTNASSVMMALIPQCAAGRNSIIYINEVTTAAAVLAAGQFFGTTYGAGMAPTVGGTCTGCAAGTYNTGLVAAFSYTYPTLVSNSTGAAVASGTTNGIIVTREASKLNTLANVLAACVNSTGSTSTMETTTVCGKLFDYSNAKAATPRPATTVQAMLGIALYPYNNVTNLYNLSSSTPPFVGLSSVPNDWTLAVSYTSSGFGLGIAGSATSRTSTSMDIDPAGRVWFPTNIASSHGIGYFDPATTTMNGPYGTSAVKPQYLAIDTESTPYVFVTDLSANSGVVTVNTSTLATTSQPYLYNTPSSASAIGVGAGNFSILGALASGSYLDYTGGQTSGGGAQFSPDISYSNTSAASGWAASNNGFNASTSYTFLAASGASTPCLYGAYEYENSSFRLSTTGTAPCYSGGALTYSLTNGLFAMASTGQVCYSNSTSPTTATQGCVTPAVPVNLPQGIALDGAKNLWLANSGNASVSTLATTGTAFAATSTLAYLHNSNYGNTLTTPFGIAVDKSGNVWVTNAGCVTTSSTACTPGAFVLTEIVGAGAPTVTPLSAQNSESSWGTRPTR